MKIHAWYGLLLGLLLFLGAAPQFALAQETTGATTNLESRVSRLEHQVRSHADEGLAVVLFGAFCALWAQGTRRNAWLWFFLGAFFNVITVLVLLYKNSKDRQQRAGVT